MTIKLERSDMKVLMSNLEESIADYSRIIYLYEEEEKQRKKILLFNSYAEAISFYKTKKEKAKELVKNIQEQVKEIFISESALENM